MKAKPLTLEENKRLAKKVLDPIVAAVDVAVREFDLARLKATLKRMRGHRSTAEAFPFPETQRKADTLAVQNEFFAAVVGLVEKRKAIMKDAMKSRETPGAAVMRALGM